MIDERSTCLPTASTAAAAVVLAPLASMSTDTRIGPKKVRFTSANKSSPAATFEPPTKIRWTEVSTGPVETPEGGYDLSPARAGTQLTYYNVLEPANFIGRLVVGFALRSARKGADDFAASIKRTVESEVPAAG